MTKICMILMAAFLMCVPVSCSLQRALTVDQSSASMSASRINETYSPGGRVEEVFYDCSVPGPSRRRMLVYLPEGYDEGGRYPVTYLFHGARGNETSWIKDGDLLRVQDSLVSAGLAVPSITVMPNMNQYDDDEDFGESRFKRPIESFFETNGTVESAFIRDVVRVVDSLYRTVPDKRHRAVAGLSVGALQSIFISANSPDMFDYVGLFSPMYRSPALSGDEIPFYRGLEDKIERQFSQKPRLYSIQIGTGDIFHSHMKRFRHFLDISGASYEYYETKGGHSWTSWRQFYKNFAVKAFK